MRTFRLALSVLTLLAFAAPAAATDFVPVLNTERVYFHCGGNAKATAGETTSYAWNTTAPTTSYTQNGGCGAVDVSYQQGDEPVFTGTHTGNLDQLTVHAWVIDAGLSRTGAFTDVWLQATVLVDGVAVAQATDLRVVPQPSETGISRLLEFSVTKIGLLAESDNVTHTVEVRLGSMPYEDGDNIGWVLDATELDSGITFSPTKLAPVRIS